MKEGKLYIEFHQRAMLFEHVKINN